MKKILVALIALAFATLACSVFVGGPSYPATSIPVSTEAAQSLKNQVQQSVATGTASGTVTLHITEEQLTSYLAVYLQSQPNLPITESASAVTERANGIAWQCSTGHVQRQCQHDAGR